MAIEIVKRKKNTAVVTRVMPLNRSEKVITKKDVDPEKHTRKLIKKKTRKVITLKDVNAKKSKEAANKRKPVKRIKNI